MVGTTASQAVTDRLRAMVLGGEIEAGSRLQERQMAERLGVSRTPVRESLQTLAAEGLLDYSPHSGYVVRRFDLGELMDSFDVRMVLEGLGCRILASRGLSEELEHELEENLHESDSVVRGADEWTSSSQDRWLHLNSLFHHSIIQFSGNRYLISGVAQTLRVPLIFDQTMHGHSRDDMARLYSRDQSRQALMDHHRILDALRASQPDRAEFLMREHIFTNREQLRVYWDRIQSGKLTEHISSAS
jgi:GntR family transcriptional regulator of vanillate catabolism